MSRAAAALGIERLQPRGDFHAPIATSACQDFSTSVAIQQPHPLNLVRHTLPLNHPIAIRSTLFLLQVWGKP